MVAGGRCDGFRQRYESIETGRPYCSDQLGVGVKPRLQILPPGAPRQIYYSFCLHGGGVNVVLVELWTRTIIPITQGFLDGGPVLAGNATV